MIITSLKGIVEISIILVFLVLPQSLVLPIYDMPIKRICLISGNQVCPLRYPYPSFQLPNFVYDVCD